MVLNIKNLRNTNRLSTILIIFLTSMEGMNSEVEELIHGMEDFIQNLVHVVLPKLKVKR